MDRYLITGSSGFVGKYFIDYLEQLKIPTQVCGVDANILKLNIETLHYVDSRFIQMDLLNIDLLEKVIAEFSPNYILHLASFSSVAYSWKYPVESFRNNTNILLNLLESVRRLNIKCRILSIGSSEEYGIVPIESIPLKEDHPLNPISPYSIARVSQELISKIYISGYGLDIVMTRSFNHIGPYQNDSFVIPFFAKQIIQLKKQGCRQGEIITGNINIIRDFIDVRDVVCAYYLLFKNGKTGGIYNICSGKGFSLKEVIEMICNIVKINVKIKTDKNRIRPLDNEIIVGCNEKIKRELGWENKISIQDSLKDVLDWLDKI